MTEETSAGIRSLVKKAPLLPIPHQGIGQGEILHYRDETFREKIPVEQWRNKGKNNKKTFWCQVHQMTSERYLVKRPNSLAGNKNTRNYGSLKPEPPPSERIPPKMGGSSGKEKRTPPGKKPPGRKTNPESKKTSGLRKRENKGDENQIPVRKGISSLSLNWPLEKSRKKFLAISPSRVQPINPAGKGFKQ